MARVWIIGAVTDLAYKPCRGRSNLPLLQSIVPDLESGRVEAPKVPTAGRGCKVILVFDSTKYFTAAAVAAYTLLNGALTLWVVYAERGTVYVGTSPPSAGGERTVRISTSTYRSFNFRAQCPQLSLQHTSPNGHTLSPQENPTHASMVQPTPGLVQTPQLGLQQLVPLAQTTGPHWPSRATHADLPSRVSHAVPAGQRMTAHPPSWRWLSSSGFPT
ncbi:hypothetical protein C8A00DRAFT_28683 [Chaetomidium leptoderma]|uniref:Signal peptidase complex subunit 2 n=1 Tax=Chaetomidium leptoderma TaxID=669021 RepID=A0AAN6VV42_9PEZI|nr:hypothetical protein C8A00DRAFT_28683 [Chaetomidium leptoderma]